MYTKWHYRLSLTKSHSVIVSENVTLCYKRSNNFSCHESLRKSISHCVLQLSVTCFLSQVGKNVRDSSASDRYLYFSFPVFLFAFLQYRHTKHSMLFRTCTVTDLMCVTFGGRCSVFMRTAKSCNSTYIRYAPICE